jgi:hypothetical protein
MRWMAPERFEPPYPEPTKASDVYAFAHLVCEVCLDPSLLPIHIYFPDATTDIQKSEALAGLS